MRVLVVGDCIVDVIVGPDGERREPGGAGLNLAVGLSRLGVPAALTAPMGTDADAARLRAYLRHHDVGLLALPGPAATGVATSDRRDGEPSYRFNAALLGRTMTFGPREYRAAASASAVVVNTFTHDDDAQAAGLGALVAPAARLVVDANPRPALLRDRSRFRANLEALAARCALLKLGDEDVTLLYPGEHPDAVAARMLALGTGAVLLTLGSRGAAVLTRTGRIDEPVATLPGPVVDTMGAGDATLATVLAALVTRGTPPHPEAWRPVLRLAMHIAAATCRRPGARLTLP